VEEDDFDMGFDHGFGQISEYDPSNPAPVAEK
jgi:hypothetical protein